MTTFADYLTTGSGETAFRLVIEGCPYIFVSDPRMECAMDDGRLVVRGLLNEELKVREFIRMTTAELDVTLGSLRIAETDGPYLDAASRAFSSFTTDSFLGYLATGSSVSPSDTSASVRSDAGFVVGDHVHIGTETWKVTGVTPSGTLAASTIAIERGAWDTTPQAFAATYATTSQLRNALNEITAAPGAYAGRRFWLYGHGSSEYVLDTASTTTTGTLLYRGILAQDPELTDSGTWSLSIQSRLSLFDQEIGAGLDSQSMLRGIYYPAACAFEMRLKRLTGPNNTDTFSGLDADVASIRIPGWFASQGAWCSALVTKLNTDAKVSAWGGFWDATEGDQWELYYTPAGGSPRWIEITGSNHVDGRFTNQWFIEGSETTLFLSGTRYRAGWDANVFSAAVAGRHAAEVPPLGDMRRVPRATYFPRASGITPSDEATAPYARFYLDSSAPYIAHGTLAITGATADGSEAGRSFVTITGSGAEGYVEAASGGSIAFPFCATGTFQPTLELGVLYGSIMGSTLAEFMADVVTQAPVAGNSNGPFITSDDVADWTTEVNASIAGRSFLQSRQYLFTRPKKFIDVIREECKLHSLYPYIDASGKVAVRRLPAADQRPAVLTIDSTILTPGEDFGRMQLSPDGVIARAEFKSGYDSAGDKWANEFNFNALGGAQVTKSKGKTIKIAPYVRPFLPWAGNADFSSSDAQLVLERLLSTFGRQYYTIDLAVAMKAHTLRLGDTVVVSVPQLPYAGVRRMNATTGGLTLLRAWVIGLEWPYGDDCGGTVTLLVLASNTAGYTPSAWVESATGAGTSWALTCTHAKYGDGSVADAAYFEPGFRVRLREWDSDAPTIRTGTVSSVVGDVVNVTLDSAWSGIGAAAGYVLGFARATEGITAAQKLYCFMADPAGRITYVDGTSAPARWFA